MKKIKFKILALAAFLFGSSLASPAVLADDKPYYDGSDNPYGMNYTGGNKLSAADGGNIRKFNTGKMNNLLKYKNISVDFSGDWLDGSYKSSHDCIGGSKYILIKNDTDSKDFTNHPLTATIKTYDEDRNPGNSLEINFKEIQTKGLGTSPAGGGVAIALTGQSLNLAATRGMYKTNECIDLVDGINNPNWGVGEGILFVEMVLKLKDKDGNTISHDGIYFGFSDIDSSQSYQIRNPNNILVGGQNGNMYTNKTDADMLQPNPDIGLYNKFVEANGEQLSYIYSEYNNEKEISIPSDSSIKQTNHVYVPIKRDVQEEGLNVVFGFGTQAYSGLEFYAYNFTITYESDANGEITGKDSEEVYKNEHPSGTKVTPNKDYSFSHWTANKDVTLDDEDKTVIKKDGKISNAQLLKVKVTEDITFTAVNVPQYVVTYDSDPNGEIIGIKTEDVLKDGNPTSTETKSNDGYQLSHWVADTDVKLKDGTTIKKGDPITTEQIKKVVVSGNINFTAINVKGPITPDTGSSTQAFNGAVIPVSIAGLITLAIILFYLPRLNRKKINFDRK